MILVVTLSLAAMPGVAIHAVFTFRRQSKIIAALWCGNIFLHFIRAW